MKITRTFSVCAFALLVVSIFANGVLAQKKPTAIEKELKTSPTNASEYRELAIAYRDAPDVAKRNQLIFLAVAQIDVNFRDYQRKRRMGRDFFHILMDILEIGAATAVSITNGSRAKSIIGDSLAFVQGARASADKNLRLLEMQILFNKMIERRATILAEILPKASQSLEAYPFDRAYIDIVAYYNAGTWDSALSMLATDTGASAQAAENLLARKRAVGIDVVPTAAELRVGGLNIERLNVIFAEYRQFQTSLDQEKAKPTPSDTVVAELEKKQQDLLTRLRRIFALIESDVVLEPMLDELPVRYGSSSVEKLALEESLVKLRNLSTNPSAADYEKVLGKLGTLIVEKSGRDSSLNTRLLNILEAAD